MQLTQAPAPGARALIRDEEWIIQSADQCSLGGWQLSCNGVSETVRKDGKLQLADGAVIERPILDGAQPGSPINRPIRYTAPFTLVDCEADSRVAWTHFAKETSHG